ncbi:glycosyltransferase family 2 protein [Mycolicibacterium cosmeticum]|uniref:Glycosyl transferase family protein n=1 Tax=Mycolicibacterium cosmeticum TaxID=258533 RepID=W9ANW2_MYCCO|nr:glycosyltransferase family 2 protein [Mycolicibacterium cosmeticum]TLH80265.1 glycosyltransferase family 2 protein [Mycolicibacterium cosmeticum]CDO07444.1 glycosyl transferase family protein [Mycolicibacterium cosmeticum]
MREIRRDQLRCPAVVLDIDVRTSYGSTTVDVERYRTAWCLVRDGGVVVEARFFDIEDRATLTLDDVRVELAAAGLPVAATPSCSGHASLTVAIPTNRADSLPIALQSLTKQSDPDFEVLIIDNSSDGRIAAAMTDFGGLTLRTCHEPLPGISRARNCGIAYVRTDLVAWLDDDEVADPDWVAWLKRGFAAPGRPDAVAGVMLPAELETQAQVDFERYGGFNKGRPMQPQELRTGSRAVLSPLYPLPGFGAGGNMAFRTDALRSIGGFDNRLGSAIIHGGEETRALSELLHRGSLILHWPPAVTWHYHRRTNQELEKQLYGYAAGLTGFYMSWLVASPRSALEIAGLIPRGVRRILATRRSGRPGGPPAGFPENLLRASRRGLYRGAWMYLWENRHQRRYTVTR